MYNNRGRARPWAKGLEAGFRALRRFYSCKSLGSKDSMRSSSSCFLWMSSFA